MDELQMRTLPIVAVVGLALWTPVLWGANFKIAGMIDNDVALVSEDTHGTLSREKLFELLIAGKDFVAISLR